MGRNYWNKQKTAPLCYGTPKDVAILFLYVFPDVDVVCPCVAWPVQACTLAWKYMDVGYVLYTFLNLLTWLWCEYIWSKLHTYILVFLFWVYGSMQTKMLARGCLWLISRDPWSKGLNSFDALCICICVFNSAPVCHIIMIVVSCSFAVHSYTYGGQLA